ncbi:MAG: hypothetical protein ABI862_01415 [Ilumatobacteraceae bacterium]
MRSVGDALGLSKREVPPVGCSMGQAIFTETKRSAQVVNIMRPRRSLQPATIARLKPLFPDLDLENIRVRTRCRLPSNRFRQTGSIYAMTFGYTIYWRDELDEGKPVDLVHLIHEVVHVDQVRRLGGESSFACAYGRGYIDGGGVLPAYIDGPIAYYRNPLEAEAYTFDAKFRDVSGTVVAALLPPG